MTMDKAEIVIDYRRAANKQKQIRILAQLNQCAERKIAEILVGEGEELPKKYRELLQKPERRRRKFPDGEATPEDDAPAPVSPADRATDRDLFEAVATLLPDESREETAPEAVLEAAPTAEAAVDLDAWDNRGQLIPLKIPGITAERLLREACRLLGSALELEPDRYHTYSCGVLDLVHALTEEV